MAKKADGPKEVGRTPRHIAIIMDGNRRYGRREHGNSLSGHRAGGHRLRDVLGWCVELGSIEALTVFAFSTENWKRDPSEVNGMMELFLTEIPRLGEQVLKLDVRVKFLCSEPEPIPAEVRKAMDELEAKTLACGGMTLNVCLSYGGRGDVVCAARRLAEEVKAGTLDVSAIDEAAISNRLLTEGLPDPDCLIRTSGEIRISNFLVYQLAYAEMFFLDKHWPEVTQADFMDVIMQFQARGRRFGK